MANVLIVDDDFSTLSLLKTFLEPGGYNISTAGNGTDALALLHDQFFDLMITDLCMPGCDGITLLKKAQEVQKHIAVVVISASDDISDAVNAMRYGAFDYISKPFNFEELMYTVRRALSYEDLVTENKVLRNSLSGNNPGYGFIIGDSPKMIDIFRLIEKVAGTNSTVLILGESGTGKELIAQAVHNCSSRADGPFVKVNCTAMPENLLESELFGHEKGAFTGATESKIGLFEAAAGGTIFLDEIGSIPLQMQAKLLRTLQEKEIRRVGGIKECQVDVRVIAATNEDLQTKLKSGEFREDLYFRLSVIPINVPPLRERKEDIPLLTEYFLDAYTQEYGRKVDIADDALRALVEYSWPGNIRQLENLIKRIAILNDSGQIRARELPQELVGFQKTERIDNLADFIEQPAEEFLSLKEYLKNVENAYIKNVLKYCNGDKDKAARTLGVSLATLYRKI